MKLRALGYAAVAACAMLVTRVEPSFARRTSSTHSTQRIETEQLATQARSLLTQQGEATPIVRIDILEVDGGIEITLGTPSGELSRPFTTINGNTFTADIENAVLSLPEGGDFRVDSPVSGVDSIEGIQLGAQQVQIRVVASEAIQDASVSIDSQSLTLGVLSGAPTVANSAEQPSEANDSLRLVVTAEKRPDEVQDVPISLTALSREDIEDADIDSLEDIAGATPNFTAYTPNRSFVLYSIRGLSNLNFLSRDAAAFYVDDIPYDYTGFLDLDLTDLEQVEVLRGPQSTLYGRNAIAGVVNITTRRPTNDPEYSFTSTLGNYISPELRASASGPIIDDELFFRLSGDFKDREGYLINTDTGEDVDFESGGGGRAQLLWTPSDNWEVLLNTAFSRYRDGILPISRPDLNQDPSETEINVDGFNNLDTNAQALSVNYENDSLRFTSITARRFSEQSFLNDSDGTRFSEIEQIVDVNSTSLSQELRLQSAEEDGPFTWLLGAYAEDRDFNVDQEGFRFGTAAPSVGSAVIQEETYAIFGQASYRPVGPLTLTAGLRYEIFNSKLAETRTRSGATFSDETNNGTEWLPRFALEYQFTPDIMAYGSVSRGYRAQGVNFRASAPEELFFNEERSWNYEAGLRTSWLDNRLAANISVFHNPISDFQVPSPDPASSLFNLVDNADVTINGLEAELRATPVDGLDLTAGFGLLDATYTDYEDPTLGNFNGNRLTYTPEYTFNLAAQYRSVDGIFGRLELQGFGTTFFDDPNTLKQEPYVLVNARAGYEFDDSKGLHLFVNNLFNYRPFTSQADFVTSIPSTYGAPTSAGIQYRMEF